MPVKKVTVPRDWLENVVKFLGNIMINSQLEENYLSLVDLFWRLISNILRAQKGSLIEMDSDSYKKIEYLHSVQFA